MGLPIFHSQYTAAQIEASIGKTPRIKAATRTWEIWDIATSAYVDTGVSIDTELFVDNTLTEAGYAADAKVTGDKLGELKSALNYNKTATPGYLLRATNNGHGSEWSPVGLPSDAQTAAAVSDWLDEHPEATTTVQDGSLTEAKFTEQLKIKALGENAYKTAVYIPDEGDFATEINSILQNNDIDTVIVPPGIYEVTRSIEVPAGKTLKLSGNYHYDEDQSLYSILRPSNSIVVVKLLGFKSGIDGGFIQLQTTQSTAVQVAAYGANCSYAFAINGKISGNRSTSSGGENQKGVQIECQDPDDVLDDGYASFCKFDMWIAGVECAYHLHTQTHTDATNVNDTVWISQCYFDGYLTNCGRYIFIEKLIEIANAGDYSFISATCQYGPKHIGEEDWYAITINSNRCLIVSTLWDFANNKINIVKGTYNIITNVAKTEGVSDNGSANVYALTNTITNSRTQLYYNRYSAAGEIEIPDYGKYNALSVNIFGDEDFGISFIIPKAMNSFKTPFFLNGSPYSGVSIFTTGYVSNGIVKVTRVNLTGYGGVTLQVFGLN